MDKRKAKNKLIDCVSFVSAKLTLISASAVLAANSLLVVSATDYSGSAKGASAENLVNKAVDFVTDIFRYIGVLLLVWSIGMLILAFKNEDADSKSRAMMMTVSAVALISVKTILKQVLGV